MSLFLNLRIVYLYTDNLKNIVKGLTVRIKKFFVNFLSCI